MSDIFSKRLRELRNKRGLTQASFADSLGITAQNYNRYEHGRIPRADILSGISCVCDVPVDWLLGRDSTLCELRDRGVPRLEKGNNATSGQGCPEVGKGSEQAIHGAAESSALALDRRRKLAAFSEQDQARAVEMLDLVESLTPAMLGGRELEFCTETMRTAVDNFIAWCETLEAGRNK